MLTLAVDAGEAALPELFSDAVLFLPFAIPMIDKKVMIASAIPTMAHRGTLFAARGVLYARWPRYDDLRLPLWCARKGLSYRLVVL